MIPYSYNMVDMGGIDLAEANGSVVEGLYERLALARNACGDLILFNWKFAGIEIAPSPCSTLDEGTVIVINGSIQVTEQDEVTVPGINPDPVLAPLVAQANGLYSPEEGVDGFSTVLVQVPQSAPVDVQLELSAGVTFIGSSFELDGCVFVCGRFNFSSASGWRSLATVADGYRPSNTIGFIAGHGGVVAVRDGTLSTSGVINIYTESSDSYLQFSLFYKI